jgi:hypothetical protein
METFWIWKKPEGKNQIFGYLLKQSLFPYNKINCLVASGEGIREGFSFLISAQGAGNRTQRPHDCTQNHLVK